MLINRKSISQFVKYLIWLCMTVVLIAYIFSLNLHETMLNLRPTMAFLSPYTPSTEPTKMAQVDSTMVNKLSLTVKYTEPTKMTQVDNAMVNKLSLTVKHTEPTKMTQVDNAMVNKLSLTVKHTEPIRKRNCTVILRTPRERLANVLFEFSTAYGLSLEHSCRLYVGPKVLEKLNRYFEINIPDLLTESELDHINRTFTIKTYNTLCKYIPGILHPNASQHISLEGFWQIYKYFNNHSDQIRETLQFKQTILDAAKTFIQTIKKTKTNLVGIHIRRGDFISQNRKISSDQYIFDAMAYFKRKYKSVNFVFVSDDKPYCRKVFGKARGTFFSPDSFNAGEDLALLTLCDHVIITVGTYGWWGGYLLQNRRGEILTDSKPDHSTLDVNCPASVYFPPWYKFLN